MEINDDSWNSECFHFLISEEFSNILQMQITTHQTGNAKIAEINSDQILIQNAEDGKDLLGNMYYQGFEWIIIYDKNISPDFFDLQNGMAGEILQKFSNYRMKLSIIGSFTEITSKSLKAFITESNKSGLIGFRESLEEALEYPG